MIKFTTAAKYKIVEFLNKESKDESYFVRVGVHGGGCAGMKYTIEFDSILKENDEKFENGGIKIVCDKSNLLYLSGLEIDYRDSLNSKGFEWKNPNATRVCSCGASFSI